MSSKCVSQYTLDGVFVKTHPNAAAAAKAISVSRTSMCFALNGKLKSSGGFLWRYFACDKLDESECAAKPAKPRKLTGKPVSQYTLSGKLVKTYDNVRLAAKDSYISVSAIYYSANRLRASSCGYIWRYYEVEQLTQDQILATEREEK